MKVWFHQSTHPADHSHPPRRSFTKKGLKVLENVFLHVFFFFMTHRFQSIKNSTHSLSAVQWVLLNILACQCQNNDSPVAVLFPNRRLFLCQRQSCLRLCPLSCSVTDHSNGPPPPPLQPPTSLLRLAHLTVPSSRAQHETSSGTICCDFDKDAVKLCVCLWLSKGVAC